MPRQRTSIPRASRNPFARREAEQREFERLAYQQATARQLTQQAQQQAEAEAYASRNSWWARTPSETIEVPPPRHSDVMAAFDRVLARMRQGQGDQCNQAMREQPIVQAVYPWQQLGTRVRIAEEYPPEPPQRIMIPDAPEGTDIQEYMREAINQVHMDASRNREAELVVGPTTFARLGASLHGLQRFSSHVHDSEGTSNLHFRGHRIVFDHQDFTRHAQERLPCQSGTCSLCQGRQDRLPLGTTLQQMMEALLYAPEPSPPAPRMRSNASRPRNASASSRRRANGRRTSPRQPIAAYNPETATPIPARHPRLP